MRRVFPAPSTGGVALVARLAPPAEAAARELAALPAATAALAVPAELAGELGVDWLRDRFGGALVHSLPLDPRGLDGGSSPAARARRLAAAAAAGWELIELDAGLDLGPEALAAVPAGRRAIVWRPERDAAPAAAGLAAAVAALADRFAELAAVPARLYRIETPDTPGAPEAALAALGLLARLGQLGRGGRRDVAAWGAGEAGFWSRLVAPRLGAPVVYAAAGPSTPDSSGGGGEPPAARLLADYDLAALPAVRHLAGIAGPAALGSDAPRLHNAGYRALGLPALYLPFAVADFAGFRRALLDTGALAALGLGWCGLTVVAPHKEAALAAAAAAGRAARRAGAANLLLPASGGDPGSATGWRAATTDPWGVLAPLRRRGVRLAGAPAAVIGAGGTGRAAAWALRRAGARVTLVHRDPGRGRAAAGALGVGFAPLAGFSPRGFAVVVQATPVGGRGEPPPFPPAELDPGAVVVEPVYGPEPTPLAAAARARGVAVADGREVLAAQTRLQFRLMTGRRLEIGFGVP